jgi:hypothetical protein
MQGDNTIPVIEPEKQEESRDTRWKPGQSGNPKGRPPKGYSISEIIKSMLSEDPDIKKKLGQKIMDLALAGDINAIKTIWSYMDGMPTQKVEALVEESEGVRLLKDLLGNDEHEIKNNGDREAFPSQQPAGNLDTKPEEDS